MRGAYADLGYLCNFVAALNPVIMEIKSRFDHFNINVTDSDAVSNFTTRRWA